VCKPEARSLQDAHVRPGLLVVDSPPRWGQQLIMRLVAPPPTPILLGMTSRYLFGAGCRLYYSDCSDPIVCPRMGGCGVPSGTMCWHAELQACT
jgi:hypothetical protein